MTMMADRIRTTRTSYSYSYSYSVLAVLVAFAIGILVGVKTEKTHLLYYTTNEYGNDDQTTKVVESGLHQTVQNSLTELQKLVDQFSESMQRQSANTGRALRVQQQQQGDDDDAYLESLTTDLTSRLEEVQQGVRELHKCNVFDKREESPDPTLLVGAYYYPWHKNDFHNSEGYVRSKLNPPQYPVLGEYDDSDSETIIRHLKWSKRANIGLWCTSWWGADTDTDMTTRTAIFPEIKGVYAHMKVALHYESRGRLKALDANGKIILSTAKVASDIAYMCTHYFDRNQYYRIDGRPVLVVYVTRALEAKGIMEETILEMRKAAAQACGEDLYLIGDHVFGSAPTDSDLENGVSSSFLYFDAVTNYDVYGSMIQGADVTYAGKKLVKNYYKQQKDWRRIAWDHGCRFVPAVSPGFNDRGVRLEVDHKALSRKLTKGAEAGSLFEFALPRAFELADPLVQNLVMINSFNEWHEDTQIEPVKKKKGRVPATTTLPDDLTNGLDYEAYGTKYIDILRDAYESFEVAVK